MTQGAALRYSHAFSDRARRLSAAREEGDGLEMRFGQQGFRFVGFGDACRIGTDRVYAMVHFRPANIPQAQMWLSVYREKHRIPEGYVLNGSQLGAVFSTYATEGPLTPAALTNFFVDLVTALNRVPGLLRFAHHRAVAQEFAALDGQSSTPIDAKELLRACYTVPNDGSQGPPAHETRIVIREGSSADAPLVDRAGQVSIPVHAATEVKEPLLDYAAAMACLSALSMTGRAEHQFYVDAVRRVKHWSSVEVTPR